MIGPLSPLKTCTFRHTVRHWTGEIGDVQRDTRHFGVLKKERLDTLRQLRGAYGHKQPKDAEGMFWWTQSDISIYILDTYLGKFM